MQPHWRGNSSGVPIDESLKLRAPLTACRELAGAMTDWSWSHTFLNIKGNIFLSMFHIPALWYFGISVIYPQGFRRVKFVIIPPCFIKQQYLLKVVIQAEVRCIWANSRCTGCSPLGETHCETGLMTVTHQQARYTTWYYGNSRRMVRINQNNAEGILNCQSLREYFIIIQKHVYISYCT